MNLRKLEKNWNLMGEKDPWWAILAHKGKRNHWDAEEFFATGRELVESLMIWLQHNNLSVNQYTALDFGCGAGRITQALTEHFQRVTGVDIAPSMIKLANDLNPLAERCEFVLNTEPNLEVFADNSFDFICSIIVLQHMEPRYMRDYLREFARIVRPGGVIAVQIPEQPIGKFMGSIRRVFTHPWLQRIANVYRMARHRVAGSMEMYGMKREKVMKLLSDSGLHVVRVSKCTSAGPNWTSYRYLAVRETVHDTVDDSFDSLEPERQPAEVDAELAES